MPKPSLLFWVAIAPSIAGVACAADRGEEPESTTAELREIFRIGVIDGPEEYTFGEIGAFTVGPSGEIYIAEARGSVRKFDGNGEFVQRIAAEGEGPGEVDRAVGMAVSRNGELAVVDFGNERISIWSSEGEFVRQVRRPLGRPRYGREAIRYDGAGQLWLGLQPPRSGPYAQSGGPRPIYGHLTGDGEIRDTIFLPAREWEGCVRRDARYASGYFEDVRLPFAPMVQWARGSDGSLAFGCSARYEFEVVRPDGSRTIATRSQWEPPRMTSEEHDFWTGIPGPGLGQIPATRPAYLRLWVTEDGSTWVWPGRPGRRWEVSEDLRARGAPAFAWDYYSPTDGFDVFDRQGRWRGHVATPANWVAAPFPGTTDPFIRGDTVWAITHDELGAHYLSKFVVEWANAILLQARPK